MSDILTTARDTHDPYLPSLANNLLSGHSEWRNIDDIIRITFKSIIDAITA